ncbi:MAG: class II aldolase/adducin family protein, partial [Bacteroidales bacterium]|nr:class II aldolase/adducin family protein [Bacteroidales bacterium]
VIIETFKEREIDPDYTPGVLCTNHGVFSWGTDPDNAVHNSVVMEEVAKMALKTEILRPDVKPAPDYLKDKH